MTHLRKRNGRIHMLRLVSFLRRSRSRGGHRAASEGSVEVFDCGRVVVFWNLTWRRGCGARTIWVALVYQVRACYDLRQPCSSHGLLASLIDGCVNVLGLEHLFAALECTSTNQGAPRARC